MSPSCPFFWVDAFTERPFAGNPAGVCLLERWPDDALLQRMAWQHGLAETAFVVPTDRGRYHLRWFTPIVEMDLCGHATLAAAHVLFRELDQMEGAVVFDARSGPLTVRPQAAGRLELDLPARPPEPQALSAAPPALQEALDGAVFTDFGRSRDLLCVLADADAVRRLCPDMAKLATVEAHAIIVTAPGDDCDFVSRFFAPRVGVPEDPVTGSAHCTLVPYWAQRLGRRHLHARQLSARGGELWCEHDGDRVRLAGHAVTYIRGTVRA